MDLKVTDLRYLKFIQLLFNYPEFGVIKSGKKIKINYGEFATIKK